MGCREGELYKGYIGFITWLPTSNTNVKEKDKSMENNMETVIM